MLRLVLLIAVVAIPVFCQVQVDVRTNQATYLVGEPTFVVVDVKNIGPEPVAKSNGSVDSAAEAGAAIVEAHLSGTPSPYRRSPRASPLPQLRLDSFQLRCPALADGLSSYGEAARFAARPINVSETGKVIGLRLPFPSLLPALGGISFEFN